MNFPSRTTESCGDVNFPSRTPESCGDVNFPSRTTENCGDMNTEKKLKKLIYGRHGRVRFLKRKIRTFAACNPVRMNNRVLVQGASGRSCGYMSCSKRKLDAGKS